MTTVMEKRFRRTKSTMENLETTIYETVAKSYPVTIRQLFYRLVAAGVIPKTEQQYKGTVCRLLTMMRKNNKLPFDWVVDDSRYARKPQSYNCLEHMLEDVQEDYRRDLWNEQNCYVEIWSEKEAIANLLLRVTAKWDVPLMVSKGYSSTTFLHSAAETIAGIYKPVFLYYFGDYDPSGCDISRYVEQEIRGYAPDADVSFARVAVNEEQIAELDLQTRPTKKGDPRAKKFGLSSVEVDAIPPEILLNMVEKCIVRHIDLDQLKKTKHAEKVERQRLATLIESHYEQ